MQLQVPENVIWIIETLKAAGHEAYAVGGCVRDCILGREPNDWDITTSALPEQVKEHFLRTVDTGIKHGTVTVMIGKTGYEVTTYRVDGTYSDSRHPDSVSFTRSLEEDLKRRDFTINAMAYNDEDGMVDLFGGVEDLEKGIVRCVGNAHERFGEDALRILRAVRFAAQLDFVIDRETEEAATELAPRLTGISAERIHVELYKLLYSKRPDKLAKIHSLGLDRYILPELEAVYESENPKAAELEKRLMASEPAPYLRWAILFYYTGNARRIMRRLKFDNHTIGMVELLLSFADRSFENVSPYVMRSCMNEAGSGNLPLIFEFSGILHPESDLSEAVSLYDSIVAAGDATSLSELAADGRDLIAIGAEKGKTLGELLNTLLQKVLHNPELNTKEQLLEIAGELMKEK